MVFEPDNAFLRYVRIGDHEVLRGINAPIRNELWGTVRPVVTNVQHEQYEDHFSLTFDAHCRERDIDFLWKGSLIGSAEGVVEFTFEGTARTTFKRNRIGFCVLHGPSAAGKPWVIENVTGTKEKGRFPKFISPQQPAKGIRGIAHELAPDLWAHVLMEGDTFEMEDQRNWTDASFKTYCTPLEKPYPVVVEKGTKITQKITIQLNGDTRKYRAAKKGVADGVTLTLTKQEIALPRIGLQVSSEIETLSDTEVARLKQLHLDHLRVHLTPADESLAGKLREATKQANALGVKLHVALHSTSVAEFVRVAEAAITIRPPVSTWFLIGVDKEQYQLARKTLGAISKGALFGAPPPKAIGFTELNRSRPDPAMMGVVAYPVTPQIHASDNASIVETLPIQGDTVRSARQFIGDAPLVISPVTLHSQLPGAAPLPGELPWHVDARQPSLFAAGWTVGSFKFLAEAGVHGITFYETIGWKGIMDAASPPKRPDKFSSKPGEVFPIYHVLRDIADFTGGTILGFESSDGLSVVGLALKKGGRQRLLIANFRDRPQSATLLGLGAKTVTISQLDAESMASANKDPETFSQRAGKRQSSDQPLALPPHAIIRVDYEH